MNFPMIAGFCTAMMNMVWTNAVILNEKPFVWQERAMPAKKTTAIAGVVRTYVVSHHSLRTAGKIVDRLRFPWCPVFFLISMLILLMCTLR